MHDWVGANNAFAKGPLEKKYSAYPRFIEILVSTVEFKQPNEVKPNVYIKAVARVLDQYEDPDSLRPFLPITDPTGAQSYSDFGLDKSGYVPIGVFAIGGNSAYNSEWRNHEWIKWGHDPHTGTDPSMAVNVRPGDDMFGTENISRWKSFHVSRGDVQRVPDDNYSYTKIAAGVSPSTGVSSRFNNLGLQEYPWKNMNTTNVSSQSDDYLLHDVYGEEMLGTGITLFPIPTPGIGSSDSGVVNPLRPPKPPQYGTLRIESGIVFKLLGGYITSGNYGYATSFQYPPENTQDSPVINRWQGPQGREEFVLGAYRRVLKSATTDYPDLGLEYTRSKAALCHDVELFFDAGVDPSTVIDPATKNQILIDGKAGAFHGFRPEAFALMGHNAPGYKIEFFQEDPYKSSAESVVSFTCVLGGEPHAISGRDCTRP